eukprot:398941-Prymnesium_polylepis.2
MTNSIALTELLRKRLIRGSLQPWCLSLGAIKACVNKRERQKVRKQIIISVRRQQKSAWKRHELSAPTSNRKLPVVTPWIESVKEVKCSPKSAAVRIDGSLDAICRKLIMAMIEPCAHNMHHKNGGWLHASARKRLGAIATAQGYGPGACYSLG